MRQRINLITLKLIKYEIIFNRSDVLKITPSSYIEETGVIEGFNDLLTELKDNLKKKRKSLDIIRPYPRLVFLGTGSCIPNKTRNTSGILLQTKYLS